jgi:hypothetical protein
MTLSIFKGLHFQFRGKQKKKNEALSTFWEPKSHFWPSSSLLDTNTPVSMLQHKHTLRMSKKLHAIPTSWEPNIQYWPSLSVLDTNTPGSMLQPKLIGYL